MQEVHIWQTLVGVVVLTRDSFGFSFCGTPEEIAKLRADLESGVPVGKAVGFSGSHCSFDSLVRVESKPNSPTVFVVGRDFLGKSKEDFTFVHRHDREEFFEKLRDLLGPDWRWQQESRGGWVLAVAPVLSFLFCSFCVLCSGILIVTPRRDTPRPDAKGPPLPEAVPWIMAGVGLVLCALCVYWFFRTRRSGGGITWEVITRK